VKKSDLGLQTLGKSSWPLVDCRRSLVKQCLRYEVSFHSFLCSEVNEVIIFGDGTQS